MPSAKKIHAWGGSLQIGTRSTDKLGFAGATPVTVPGTYAVTNWTSDVAMDCNTAAAAEIADVLGTLIKHLISLGLIDGSVAA